MTKNATLYAARPSAFTTFSGTMIDLINPSPDDINFNDISHHLASTPRYGGALATKDGYPVIYTVAEHSLYVMVAALEGGVAAFANPKRYGQQALHALLHDAPEAYCGDAIGPLKAAMRIVSGQSPSPYDVIEERLEKAIHEAYGLVADDEMVRVTKDADVRVYAAESAALRRWNRQQFASHSGGVELYDRRWRGLIEVMEPFNVRTTYEHALWAAIRGNTSIIQGIVADLEDANQ